MHVFLLHSDALSNFVRHSSLMADAFEDVDTIHALLSAASSDVQYIVQEAAVNALIMCAKHNQLKQVCKVWQNTINANR